MRILSVIMGAAVCVCAAGAARAELAGTENIFYQTENAALEKHQQEVKADNKKFRATLKGASKADKTKALEERRLFRFREDEAFYRKLHEDALVVLRDRLSANALMSPADKEELLKVYDAQYRESVLILGRGHQESMDSFEKIANDPALTQAQKRAELKNYFQKRKNEALKQREQQRQQRQAELQKQYSAESSSSPVPRAK